MSPSVESLKERARTVARFLRPLDARASDEATTEPFPPDLPEGRIVPIPDRGEMFVREIPASEPGAPVVTLLHGWTLTADLNWFSGGYEVAARHGRVIAPDIRGHGRGLRSERPFTLEAAADDVAGMLEQLGVTRSVVVGYSMGGSIALLLADRHPELVSGLVLAATGLQWRASARERLLWAGMAGVEYVLRFGAPKGITDRYLRQAAEESPDLERYSGWLKAEVRRGDPPDIAAAGRSLSTYDARDLVRRIDVPAAVIVGCQDHLIRADKQHALADAIEGASTIEIAGAHNAWMVRPKEFAGAIDEGLDLVLGTDE